MTHDGAIEARVQTEKYFEESCGGRTHDGVNLKRVRNSSALLAAQLAAIRALDAPLPAS